MSICRGCGHRSPDDWCSICSMLVPPITGDTIGIMPEESEIDEVISEVGQTRGSRANRDSLESKPVDNRATSRLDSG
jgi:hypothetical protein